MADGKTGSAPNVHDAVYEFMREKIVGKRALYSPTKQKGVIINVNLAPGNMMQSAYIEFKPDGSSEPMRLDTHFWKGLELEV